MVVYELGAPVGDAVAEFEGAVSMLGLAVRAGTLAKYPGCSHWHLTTAGKRGTIEATWWPDKRRLWLAIHDNRRAAWQDACVARLIQQFPLKH